LAFVLVTVVCEREVEGVSADNRFVPVFLGRGRLHRSGRGRYCSVGREL